MTDEEIEARVGSRVDRWTLRRVVGRGGMAAVYEGVDDDGQRAAVKLLHDEYVGSAGIQRRFLREAFILGVGKHPAAVQVHKQGLANGVPFFAMEFVEGETLQSRWGAVGAMAPAEVVGYARSLLEILAAYHKEGVVHRDIKPANLIVAGSGVRLIDFGVARYRDMGTSAAEYTRDGSTLGTPSFMPPEQALGKIDRIDQRSDIFSVGALMYALLSAKFVHAGSTSEEMLVAAASRAAESVLAAAPKTPEALARIVDKALAFYPDDRYQDAAEMLAALADLQLSAPAPSVAAAPVAVPGKFEPSPIGSPNEIKAAAAVAALGVDLHESIHTGITDAVTIMFRGLRRVFESAQLYDFAHPEVERRVTEAYDLLTEILHHYPEECAFQVRMASFEVNGEPVWTPKPPFDQVPYRMFIHGVRQVRFVPGIGHEELRQLLNLMVLPTADLALEDDFATALWDLDLRHVETAMVTTFTVSEDVHEQRQFDVELHDAIEAQTRYLTREALAQIELLGLVAATGEGGLAQAGAIAREAVAVQRLSGKSFPSRFRSQFIDAIAQDTWEARTALVVSAALAEAWTERDVDRLEPMVSAILPRYMLQKRDDAGFELADRVVKRVGHEEVKKQVVAWLFRPQNVARLMLRLAHDDQVWSDETRRRASSLLADAPDDGVEEILPLFAATAADRRRVVMTYLMRNGRGRQADYAALASNAPADVARDVVQIIERIDEPASAQALIGLLEHPDESVRETVLASLAQRFPDAVERILLPMIDDASPNIRVQALRLARSIRSPLIRDRLVAQVTSSHFHELPFTERRLAVETLYGIDPQHAEQVLAELGRKKLHLSLDPAVHTTRIMILTFLGEHGMTREGWEALDEAAKKHPGNPQNVREAAAAAMERWRSRAQ